MSDFGDRLREAMEKEKLTASELAKITGIGKNLISYYINGKCIGKQDKIYLLAKALHVDPGWLITGVQPRKRQERYRPPFSHVLGRSLIGADDPSDIRPCV